MILDEHYDDRRMNGAILTIVDGSIAVIFSSLLTSFLYINYIQVHVVSVQFIKKAILKQWLSIFNVFHVLGTFFKDFIISIIFTGVTAY